MLYIFALYSEVSLDVFFFLEFQYQVLTRLTVLRMVQQQHGDLITAFTTRYSRDKLQRLQEEEPVMKGPFNSYDELKHFDAKLSGSTRERFVSTRLVLPLVKVNLV